MKQVFLINQDLKMRKGKIAVQVAHGEVFYMYEKFTTHQYGSMHDNYIKWMKDGIMKKVVLKATEQEIRDIVIQLRRKDIWERVVVDMGLTQVEPNSLTCLVVEPLPEEQCNELFGHLKLL